MAVVVAPAAWMPPPAVAEAPLNVCTSAPAGVMAIRLLKTSGQSMAELSTEARRATPAE